MIRRINGNKYRTITKIFICLIYSLNSTIHARLSFPADENVNNNFHHESSIRGSELILMSSAQRRGILSKRRTKQQQKSGGKVKSSLPSTSPTKNPTERVTLETQVQGIGDENLGGNASVIPTVQSTSLPITLTPTGKDTSRPFSSLTTFPAEENKEMSNDSAEEEIEKLKKEELIEKEQVGGWAIIIAVCLMILTAHQMAENPDGVYASTCRLVITVSGCFLKILFFPCNKLFKNRFRDHSHHLITTTDYRDSYPSLETSMEVL